MNPRTTPSRLLNFKNRPAKGRNPEEARVEPHGGERIAKAYALSVGAAFAAALIGVIALQIADVVPACQADDSGNCSVLWGSAAALVGYLGFLWLGASWLAIRTWFWLVFVAGLMVVCQIVIEAAAFEWFLLILLLPLLAALTTNPSGDELTKRSRWVIAGVTGAVGVEFVIWTVVLLS